MTEGGAPPRQVLSPTDGGGFTADLCYSSGEPGSQVLSPTDGRRWCTADLCYSSGEPQITDLNGEPQIFSQPPQDPKRALGPHAHVRGDPLPEASPSPVRNMTRQVTRRTSTIKKTLREKMSTMREKTEGTQKQMLENALRSCRSTRDVINGLHHASSSLQADHPLFKHLLEYRQETERLEKLKEDESSANRQVSDSDCLKQAQLEYEIIEYCATPVRQEGKQREEEEEEEAEKDVNVFHIDEPGPCGESPVHLAFVLGLKDLGHDCV